MLHNPKTILHTFRSQPCALFVLIALFMPDCPDPVGEKWLARRTGYTRKTVRESGLYFLEDMGIIQRARHRRGWRLTQSAKQLPLPFPTLPGAVAGNVIEGAPTEPEPSTSGDQNGEGKVYPHGATTTATTTYRRENGSTAAAAASEGKNYPHDDREGKVYPHQPELSPMLSTAQKAVAKLLKSEGIGAPTCYDLAQLSWVTEEYVQAHVARGRENRDSLGLIIHRMKSNDPAPNGNEPTQICPECGHAGFSGSGQCLVCAGIVVH